MSEKHEPSPADEDDPIVSEPEEDALRDRVDGEAVVVPGQRPGPTEPTSF